MKTAIISASHRKGSRSFQAAEWIVESLSKLEMTSDLIDLATSELPFWSEDFWNGESELSARWTPYRDRLYACDSLIIVAPEWAGMMPPKLSNFLLLCSKQELSYKPALLVGISAGPSGTYPIAQLRMSAGKNNQMIYLPDHLINRHAGTFLAPPPDQLKNSCKDDQSHLCQRLRYNFEILRTMGRDLKQMRQSLELKTYAYGL